MIDDAEVRQLTESTRVLQASLMSLLISLAAFRRLGQLHLRNDRERQYANPQAPKT
jgi:hypothetical protein